MLPNVAFFDSGQGGLTVWEAVMRRIPRLNTIYLGDNSRYPYGNKSSITVQRFTSEAIFHLAAESAGLIIIACGTASSVATDAMRRIFRIPIVGIVEGFCADAVKQSQGQGTIALLGTRYTVSSGRFEQELKSLGAQRVWSRACPLFVPLVEEGVPSGVIGDAISLMYLSDIPTDVSVVMLACTHFPRLERSIAQTLNHLLNRPVYSINADGQWLLAGQPGDANPIYLLDSSHSLVDEVDKFIKQHPDPASLLQGMRRVLCTDAPERFAEVGRIFSNIPLPPVELVQLGS